MDKPKILLMIAVTVILIAGRYNVSFSSPEFVRLNIISTSDIHGRLDGYDYKTGIDYPIGLNRIHSLIKAEKDKDNDTIVLDGGDFNRGTPMVDIYNTLKTNEENPVISAMNLIGYDAVTPGNHELDYGKNALLKIKNEAEFSMISANIFHNNELMFQPYKVIERKGLKIGILGLTTPSAIRYNSGDDIEGIEIRDIIGQAAVYLDKLKNKERVDIIIAVIHSGIEGIYDAPDDETGVIRMTELPIKPDVIISGHAHKIIPNMVYNGVVIQSPGAMAIGAGKIELIIKKVESKWKIVDNSGVYIPSFVMNWRGPINSIAKEHKDDILEILRTSIGRYEGDGISDASNLINGVKLEAASAEVVVDEKIKEHNLSGKNLIVNDIYNIYSRENYIIGITTKGKKLKKYISLRMKSNADSFDNLFPVEIEVKGDNFELHMGNKIINDHDDVKIAVTGRQLSYDSNLRKAGIQYDKQYFNSFESYGLQGRVRNKIIEYLKNNANIK